MDVQVRQLRMIQFALIAAVVMYGFVAEVVAKNTAGAEPDTLLFNVFVAVAATVAILGFLLRQRLLRQVGEGIREGSDASAPGLYRMAIIVPMTCAEAIALFGFVLRLLGYGMKYTTTFFIVAVVLLLSWGPKRVETV